MAGLLIAVSRQTLFLAESKIAGCWNCTERADTLFEHVVDATAKPSEPASYVLPMPALCPMCHSPIIESTPVQLREKARELLVDGRLQKKQR
jgi:hypothetical protein